MTAAAGLPIGQKVAIWANAALWMAGHSLTSGAFLLYFASDLKASATLIALLAAAPELVGLSGLASPLVWKLCGNRRVAWLIATLLARGVLLCVPFAGSPWLMATGLGGPWGLLAMVTLSQLFQGVATTLYFAWLSDLTPPSGWGRLFAGRNIASLLVQMIVPLGGALARDHWKRTLPASEMWLAYAVVFLVGSLLLLISLVPMLLVRDPFSSGRPQTRSALADWGLLLRDRATRRVLAHSWCLALANGLTQAVFFKYQIGVIGLSLTGYLLLFNLMLAVQLLGSGWAGRCRLAGDHRRVLFQATFITSCALPFWMLASADRWWWLIGAFVCWGAFGAVNVAGPNLMLGFTTPGNTASALAMFRQVAGTLAGLSGILGGWLLDRGLTSWSESATAALWPYHLLFLISWLGRMLAAILVLRVPVPVPSAPLADESEPAPH